MTNSDTDDSFWFIILMMAVIFIFLCSWCNFFVIRKMKKSNSEYNDKNIINSTSKEVEV